MILELYYKIYYHINTLIKRNLNFKKNPNNFYEKNIFIIKKVFK